MTIEQWSLIIGIVGVVGSLVTIWQVVWPRLQFRISWEKIAKNSEQILDEMRTSNYRPDIIISAGRAGGILAALISGNYGGRKIQILGVDFSYNWTEVSREVSLLFPKMDLSTKKVLITVGEVHTGATLQALVQACKDNGAAEIKTAALFHSEIERFRANYVGTRINKLTKMPWHMIKDYDKSSFPKAA